MEKEFRMRRALLTAGPAVLAGCALNATGSPAEDISSKNLRSENIDSNVVRAAAALGQANQPDVTFDAISHGLANTVGHKLFTVLIVNLSTNRNQRYYSNQPKAYPVGSSKPIVRTSEVFRHVVIGGKPRILYNAEEVKKANFDYEVIHSLGCDSEVNYPISWNGQTIGTLNLLHEKNWYNEADLSTIGVFAALAVAPTLKIIGLS